MSKVFKVVGVVAGVVGAVALTVGTLGVGSSVAALALAKTLTTVGTIASVVSAAASVGARLTAKPPPARGTVNETTIGANQPNRYMMGETYEGGALIHEAGYGATRKKVKNPYYFRAVSYSLCGPVAALMGIYAEFEQINFSGSAATGFYAGYLYADVQLGATPESNALAPQWSGCPSWGADYKLSGHAGIGFSMLFDKEGERFASGQPQLGAVWRGVLCYDFRLDSTRPGGSGPQRIHDETTWGWNENPACHAVTYAYGRYANGKKIMGADLGADAIDLAGPIAWANLCDANNWKVGGTIYEPGDKWANLKEICQAGGGEPVLAGGMLKWRWQKPHVSLRTITADDLASPDMEVPSNQTWKTRRNTIVPLWRSAANKWEYVQSDPITRDEWLEEDGEPKEYEQPFRLVQQKDQAAQLGAYQIAEERGAGTITLVLKPEFMTYDPGDGLTIDIDEVGLVMVPVIVTSRSVAPETGEVTMTFMTRDPGIDAWALSQSGTAPPPSAIVTAQERDEAAGNNQNPLGYVSVLIAGSSVANAGGVGGVNPVSAIDAGSDATVDIDVHDRVYADKTVECAPNAITGLAYSTQYSIYYDDADRQGGAVTYQATTIAGDAITTPAHPDRHFVGYVTTPASGGLPSTGGGSTPPSVGGGGPIP